MGLTDIAVRVALVVTRHLPRRVIGKHGDSLRINLGSGVHVARGWVNVDAAPHLLARRLPMPLLRGLLVRTQVGAGPLGALKRERFVFADLRRPLPIADGSASFVYSSHALEHLAAGDGQRLLNEAHRMLRCGGILRVAVPDQVGAWDGAQPDGSSFLDQHRSMYDEERLGSALRAAGFEDVKRVGSGVGDFPDARVLDGAHPESLVMEACRREAIDPACPVPDSLG